MMIKNDKEKWLVISYFLNIHSMAASIHCDDRLEVLKQHNIDLVLLSSFAGKQYSNFKHYRTFSISPSGFRYELRHILKRKIPNKTLYYSAFFVCFFWALPFYVIECLLRRTKWFPLDLSWSWALSGGLIAAWLAWKHNIDYIYSTGGSVSTQTAGWVASKLSGKVWISEMQDPLTHQYNKKCPAELEFNKWVEYKIASQAKALIFLTQGAMEAAQKRLPYYKNKFFKLRPALQSIEKSNLSLFRDKHIENSTNLVFRHFGTLDGTRNLEGFLKGAMMAFKNNSLEWSLELYGHIGKSVNTQIDAFQPNTSIKQFGKITRQKSLELMCGNAVLLLIQNFSEESFETIPSKVYEYLQTGRLILGVIYQNSELGELLRSHGHYVAEVNDPLAIAKALDEIFLRFQSGELHAGLKPYMYTVAHSVEKLIEIAHTNT